MATHFDRGVKLWPAFMLLALCGLRCSAACGDTEGDRLVWARERMFPAASRSQTELVYQWLVNSTRSCSQSGDLWYYRGLVARKLGNTTDAAYSLRKADENGSKARAASFDPFSLGGSVRVSSAVHIREKFALLVGIHKFKLSDSTLRFSAKDAQELGDLLVGQQNFKKENVTVLLDEEATSDNIRLAFGKIRAVAQPDDLVLVFVSSHGLPRALDPTGISYVMTADFNSSDYATQFSTGLKMVELAEFGRWILANNYVLLIDTCYAGAVQTAGAARTDVAAGTDLIRYRVSRAPRIASSFRPVAPMRLPRKMIPVNTACSRAFSSMRFANRIRPT